MKSHWLGESPIAYSCTNDTSNWRLLKSTPTRRSLPLYFHVRGFRVSVFFHSVFFLAIVISFISWIHATLSITDPFTSSYTSTVLGNVYILPLHPRWEGRGKGKGTFIKGEDHTTRLLKHLKFRDIHTRATVGTNSHLLYYHGYIA